nr:glycine-rich cell wall structural protein 1.0-like [Solanum lycopersicum]
MEGYVIAIILFLCAFVVSVIFFTSCYKKGNNNKQRHVGINARQRNRASISGQTYDSGRAGGGNYNGNDVSGGGAAFMAGAAAMSAALTSIAIDGDGGNGGGNGGGGGGDGGGGS